MNEIPPTIDREILETAKYGEQLPEKKKFRIPLKFKIVLAFLILLALVLCGALVIKKFQEYQLERVKFKENTEQPAVEPTAVETKEYKSDKDKFTLQYPIDSILEEPSQEAAESRVYKITYAGPRQTESITTDESLTDGFIFKIIVNKDVINKDLKIIAENKIDSFKQGCSDLYTSSDTLSTQIDTIPAEEFSINNCPAYYEETFVLFNGSLYEMVIIYRGDVGYREKYLQTATQILESYRFLDKPLAPETPKFSTYKNDGYRISFVHPNLDSKCCDVNGPVSGISNKIVVFGDKQSYDDNKGKSFNGFGVFVDQNDKKISFEEYMDLQRKTLEENYKVIMGKKPESGEEKIKVGDVEGIILKNYAWWGDMIYVQIPNSSKFLIISKVETSRGVFEQVFAEILKTFRFNI
jgi:hypothetical protein